MPRIAVSSLIFLALSTGVANGGILADMWSMVDERPWRRLTLLPDEFKSKHTSGSYLNHFLITAFFDWAVKETTLNDREAEGNDTRQNLNKEICRDLASTLNMQLENCQATTIYVLHEGNMPALSFDISFSSADRVPKIEFNFAIVDGPVIKDIGKLYFLAKALPDNEKAFMKNSRREKVDSADVIRLKSLHDEPVYKLMDAFVYETGNRKQNKKSFVLYGFEETFSYWYDLNLVQSFAALIRFHGKERHFTWRKNDTKKSIMKILVTENEGRDIIRTLKARKMKKEERRKEKRDLFADLETQRVFKPKITQLIETTKIKKLNETTSENNDQTSNSNSSTKSVTSTRITKKVIRQIAE